MGEGLRFADPWVLLLLAVVPALMLIWRLRRHGRRSDTVIVASVTSFRGVPPSWRVRLQPRLPYLRMAATVLLIVGLARPQVAGARGKVMTEGIDIVVAFDISGSMAEPGLGATTKMEGAKRALVQFLDTRENDRVGFVVFKSESRVMSPMTVDYAALKQQVEQADTLNRQLPDGTAIGLGLATALNVLRESRSRSRVVILATDGENNVHTIEPEAAGKIAESLGVKVYTIGVPTARVRAELSLDERQMRQIAEGAGGSYTRAVDQPGLTQTLSRIATLEKSHFQREQFVRYVELAPWMLVPTFLLVALELLLGATVLRRAP